MPINAFSHALGKHDEVHVWCVTLDEDAGAVERAYSDLSGEERKQADQFGFASLRTSYVLSHALLRRLLAVNCDRAPSQLAFAYGPHHKPFLADGPGGIRFNMSHSGGIAAYALASGREVGIDVEQHRRLADMADIAQRFFSPREHHELMAIPESGREAAFFQCWVRKEAYIKGLGGGLSIPLDSFQAWPVVIERPAEAFGGKIDDAPSSWMIKDFTPVAGYSGAVAVERGPTRIHLHGLRSAHDLLQLFELSTLIA
jgi:4'-phosphopantetheinyl transferase